MKQSDGKGRKLNLFVGLADRSPHLKPTRQEHPVTNIKIDSLYYFLNFSGDKIVSRRKYS